MALLHRPPTPDSPMSTSLQRATHTIDDLTLALTNFSRGSSPEPRDIASCCCGKQDCETSRVWATWKSKMESRLVLSAEVGQALLERHEAFLRRRESSTRATSVQSADTLSGEEHVDARVADLVRQNAVLEKRLTQALVNSEILESSNKNAIQELQEARTNAGRLSAQNARSVGWENRLAIALQEKDDMQQERDSAMQRARSADSRIAALKEQCAKLQVQMLRLREGLEMQRAHRQEMSQEILAGARQRLEHFQQSQLGQSVKTDDVEVMKVLESLVADNEAFKHDNAELQNLLAESREDQRALQEEMEERRVGESYVRHRYTDSEHSNTHDPISPLSATFHVGTAPSVLVLHSWDRHNNVGRRPVSVERTSRRGFEPLTPETDRRPLSPTDSLIPSETKWTSFTRPHYTPSRHSYEVDEESRDDTPTSPERTRAQKSLLLLTRSRGVQTDDTTPHTGGLVPSPFPHAFGDQTSSKSPSDGRSESSSLADGQTGTLGALIDRVTMLFSRLTQADAHTLTSRLKRQHLIGADVSHLSRTTVGSILHEATTLRSHFRAFLEDEKAAVNCTRRDLRALFKLLKDMFSEMGQMRVTLNDVILDPSVAAKVSEMAMNPTKPAVAQAAGREAPAGQSSSGWMAPLSKLLGLPGSTTSSSESAATRALSPPARGRAPNRIPSRVVPKREAVLSASAMNVNVEFSGTAVGRSVTSTYSAHPDRQDSISVLSMQHLLNKPMPEPHPSRGLMGIFAGAPRPEDGADPWVVIPKPQCAPMPSIANTVGSATVGRSALRRTSSKLSRTVDAMIDADRREEEDTLGTLLERTLTHRGMSDSSIHSAFLRDGGAGPGSPPRPPGDVSAPQDRNSVLQTLSRRMQTFRFGAAPPTMEAGAGGHGSRPETSVGVRDEGGRSTPTGVRASSPQVIQGRATSPAARGLFQTVNLSSWAAAALDPALEPSSYMEGTPREEFMAHPWGRKRESDRLL